MSLGRGKSANPRDGDVVAFEVEIDHDSVAGKMMTAQGCDAAARAGGELAKWAHGKTPEDAPRIEARELISRLDLTSDEERCAIAAPRAALIDAHVRELEEREVGRR